MKKYMIAIAVLALVLTLPCTAAVEKLEPITESFGFVSAKIDNLTNGTSTTTTNLNVQSSGSYAFGNVMAYFSFNCQPSTNYRITVKLTNSGGFETEQYKQAVVLLNMWLHNYQDNGTWRYSDNGGTNVLRIKGTNNIYYNSAGSATQFTHTNTVNYIRYSYNTGIRAIDIDSMEVIFNFSTSDQTPADPSENLITFYGNIQIDNQTNDQIGGLESTIVGDPNAPTPPSVENVQVVSLIWKAPSKISLIRLVILSCLSRNGTVSLQILPAVCSLQEIYLNYYFKSILFITLFSLCCCLVSSCLY